MPTPLEGRKIFLASPGDLPEVRTRVRYLVDEYNQLHAHAKGLHFILEGFDDFAYPSGHRTQGEINHYIRKSDFMLTLFNERIGAATTPNPPYLTGVEEELAVAAAASMDPVLPMLDIQLLFKAPSTGARSAPTAQLKQLLEFRAAIEATKELPLWDFSSDDELRHTLSLVLGMWAQDLPPRADPPTYHLLLAALADGARQTMTTPSTDDPAQLIEWAEAQAADGAVTQAEAAFTKAIQHGRAPDLLRYAKFLQRRGQFARAFELDERVLGLGSVLGNDSPDAVGFRIEALANMGLVKRKQGDLPESQRLLREAVASGRPHGAAIVEPFGYALDQRGLTETRLGNLDDATNAYQEALELRREAGDITGEAQSLVNLARIARQSGDPANEVSQLSRAVGLLGSAETRLAATALAALGKALAASDLPTARKHLEKALAINEHLQITDGISVTSSGLAELCLIEGDADAALLHAQRVMDVSTSTGNLEGTAVAWRLIGQVHIAREEWTEAADALSTSVAMAIDQHDPGREAAARLLLALAQRHLDVDAARKTTTAGLAAATRSGDVVLQADLRQLLDDLG